MLGTIIAGIVIMGMLFAGMAVGVIFSNKPLKGSCGGLGAAGLKESCDLCGGVPERCKEENEAAAPVGTTNVTAGTRLAYERGTDAPGGGSGR